MSFPCKLTATCLVIWAALSSTSLFSQSKLTPKPTPSPKANSSAASTKTLTDVQMSQMSSDDLANYIFQQHGCKNCHTLGAGGKLGLTDRGMQVGKNHEGCMYLLNSMNLIAQLKDSERSPADKQTLPGSRSSVARRVIRLSRREEWGSPATERSSSRCIWRARMSRNS